MFKVKNRNTRKRCKICSKLTIKTPERRHGRRSGVFIVNFEHFPYFAPSSDVFIVDFEQINVSWIVVFDNITLLPLVLLSKKYEK